MAVLTAIVLLISAVFIFSGDNSSIEGAEPAPKYIEYNGEKYYQRKDLTTMLVMGLDKNERPEDTKGYINHYQSDFLALLIIDEDAKKVDLLHLNRDTMTKIRRLGIGGGAAGSFTGQLALAHTYGSGGSDSCLNAVKAVSTLLKGIKIDHYASFTMDAVAVINDALGGVTLTVMDDMTAIDPSFVKGQELTLKGEQALKYVRSRGGLDDSSNLRRMERQQQYMEALYSKIMKEESFSEELLADTMIELSDNFLSDCTVNQLERLVDDLQDCELSSIQSLDGEAVKGEQYMEYYVDEAALMETVINLFCKK